MGLYIRVQVGFSFLRCSKNILNLFVTNYYSTINLCIIVLILNQILNLLPAMNKDQDLIRLASLARGDESVFSEIYRDYSDGLFKYISRILSDEDDAVDVIQETFIAFWELRGKMENVKSIKAYLFVMAKNLAFKRFRERIKQVALEDKLVEYYGDTDKSTEHTINERLLSSLIDQEINKLPVKRREVFVMSRKQHLSHKEIAEKLNISDQTVRKQIQHSLKTLRLKIDDDNLLFLKLIFMLPFIW